MDYVLMTFRQRNNVRQYAFQGTTVDKQRVEFIVDVDLALVLKHGIPMQEIPLLCRRLLEEKPVSEQARKVNFTQAQMQDYAARRDAAKKEAAARRR